MKIKHLLLALACITCVGTLGFSMIRKGDQTSTEETAEQAEASSSSNTPPGGAPLPPPGPPGGPTVESSESGETPAPLPMAGPPGGPAISSSPAIPDVSAAPIPEKPKKEVKVFLLQKLYLGCGKKEKHLRQKELLN